MEPSDDDLTAEVFAAALDPSRPDGLDELLDLLDPSVELRAVEPTES